MSTPPKHGVWEISNSDYHADRTAESSSTLKTILQSVELYHGRYVTGDIVKEPTEAMKFGSAFHVFSLERDDFGNRYAFGPPVEYVSDDGKVREPLNRGSGKHERWKEHRKFYADWCEANEGKEFRDPAEEAQMAMMLGQLKSHQEAWDLIAPVLEGKGSTEKRVRFEYRGIQCKCAFDVLCQHPVSVDVKTTGEAGRDFHSKQIYELGYYISAAFYHIGYQAIFGRKLESYKFAFVHKNPPYEVELYTLKKKALEAGFRQVNLAIDRLKACREFDVFRNTTHGEEVEIDIPGWAHKQIGE